MQCTITNTWRNTRTCIFIDCKRISVYTWIDKHAGYFYEFLGIFTVWKWWWWSHIALDYNFCSDLQYLCIRNSEFSNLFTIKTVFNSNANPLSDFEFRINVYKCLLVHLCICMSVFIIIIVCCKACVHRNSCSGPDYFIWQLWWYGEE